MHLALSIQHERLMLRRHGGGYLCARLAPLFVVAACLFFAWLSLQQARELFLGPQPWSPGHALQGRQTELLFTNALLSSAALGLAWLAYGLWLLDGRAWKLALALSAPMLWHGANMLLNRQQFSRPHFACALLVLLLLLSRRIFKIHTLPAGHKYLRGVHKPDFHHR